MASNNSHPPQPERSKKRKGSPAIKSNGAQSEQVRNKKQKFERPSRQRDARKIATQTTFKAFKHGEIDVDKFVRSREFEINALEQGLINSKRALTKRAFQQVPKDLRRRTASHNVKRVPKRLQARAKREMKDDKTPTVVRRKRQASTRMRLRLQTAATLRQLGNRRTTKISEQLDPGFPLAAKTDGVPSGQTVTTRQAKIKQAVSSVDVIQGKFRKRQRDKTWLPTHLWHAKRARMTTPARPLWGFALPLTPTAKSYRPTHRAAGERGAIAYDVSYISTIMLVGVQASIMNVLSALGVTAASCGLRKAEFAKWQAGQCSITAKTFEREARHAMIAPVTAIWQAVEAARHSTQEHRSILVRVHTSAFRQLWDELVQACKVAKPAVSIHDLRYQIGSIEVVGPSATEALASVLWPYGLPDQDVPAIRKNSSDDAGTVLQKLSGLTNTSMLPAGAVLTFDIQDPRLHHPPRKRVCMDSAAEQEELMRLAADWPSEVSQRPSRLFSIRDLHPSSISLPTQHSIARRKAAAKPGQYPKPIPARDPAIPVLLFAAAKESSIKNLGGWTVLLPWKCVLPVWYSLMYVPLVIGTQPRLGAIDQQRNLALEYGCPWFPADFPATKSGHAWELQQREQLETEWRRRPKSKRVQWDSIDLGTDPKGEIGSGFACDWEHLLLKVRPVSQSDQDSPRSQLKHISAAEAHGMLRRDITVSEDDKNGLVTVRITMVSRGVPEARARIYKLPSDGNERKKWLDQSAAKPGGKHSASAPLRPQPHLRHQQLAKALLEPPKEKNQHSLGCPPESDLIGFVTSGHFDLGAGRGLAVGSIAVCTLLGSQPRIDGDGKPSSFCIVRNSGQSVARLAKWMLI